MPKYNVRIYYNTFCDVDVEANTRDEAIEVAREKAALSCYDDELMSNLVENGEWDVKED